MDSRSRDPRCCDWSRRCPHVCVACAEESVHACVLMWLAHMCRCCCVAQAAKVAPRDPDLRKKLSECEKEVKRLK